MIDKDDLDFMSGRDLVELLEAYNESVAEVKRLREGIKEQMQFALDCVGSDIGDLYETIADDLRRLIE
jgi:hypothetical protein